MLLCKGDDEKLPEIEVPAEIEDIVCNLSDNPEALLQYVLSFFFSKDGTKYDSQYSLLCLLRDYGVLTGSTAFESLPKTPDGLFSHFGAWDHKDATSKYAICSNHHIIELDTLRDVNGELNDRVCGRVGLDGAPCQSNFLKQTHSSTGRIYNEVKKPVPWVGLVSHLKSFFGHQWFMSELESSRNTPDLDGDARGDIRDSEKFVRVRLYLEREGKRYAVQLKIFIDWLVVVVIGDDSMSF